MTTSPRRRRSRRRPRSTASLCRHGKASRSPRLWRATCRKPWRRTENWCVPRTGFCVLATVLSFGAVSSAAPLPPSDWLQIASDQIPATSLTDFAGSTAIISPLEYLCAMHDNRALSRGCLPASMGRQVAAHVCSVVRIVIKPQQGPALRSRAAGDRCCLSCTHVGALQPCAHGC